MIDATFGHVNLVARDWRVLVRFYEVVFGCVAVPPERDYAGADLEAGTGVPGARVRGAHLRLPGRGPDGPTLEIYEYDPMIPADPGAANRPGFGHIAFGVPDVRLARDVVMRHGGSPLGEIVTLRTADGRRVTWVYVRDPEGNIVELQSWADAAQPTSAARG